VPVLAPGKKDVCIGILSIRDLTRGIAFGFA